MDQVLFDSLIEVPASVVNSSSHAIRIRSAVAGVSNRKLEINPISRRAAFTAFRIAKNTEVASESGGSPMAY